MESLCRIYLLSYEFNIRAIIDVLHETISRTPLSGFLSRRDKIFIGK